MFLALICLFHILPEATLDVCAPESRISCLWDPEGMGAGEGLGYTVSEEQGASQRLLLPPLSVTLAGTAD